MPDEASPHPKSTARLRESVLVHATCVAYADRGALLRGAPGTGKSDLAVRFISAFGGGGNRRAALVADDQVALACQNQKLFARAPDTIAGRLEVRGLGIVEIPRAARAELVLIVDLTGAGEVPRFPPEPRPHEEILGVALPLIRLDPFEPSAHVKLKLALTGSP